MQFSVNHHKISLSQQISLVAVVMRSLTMPRVRDGPKCAYELLTLSALSFPLKCCNSAFLVSRDNLQIRDRKTPQIRWLAHLLRICSVFALSTEKRQSDSLGRARLYCDNSQVMALVRFYTAGNQGKTEHCRTRLVPTPVLGEGARKILVRGNKSQHRINGVSQGSEVFLCQILIKTIFLPQSNSATSTLFHHINYYQTVQFCKRAKETTIVPK